MPELFVGAASAFWLGILTSVSPCPLATNIAAISFTGKNVGRPARVLAAGLLYTLGRTLTYLVIGALLTASLLSAPQVSNFLQKHMNQLLGPILILAGMFLLELLSFGFGGGAGSDKLEERARRWGVWGGGLLGIAFALSFCPVSAALFFGSLIPLSVKYDSAALLPSLYGVGTGLPVLVFAFLVALGAEQVGKAFDAVRKVEVWFRRATGAIFIGVGVYYSLVYIFNVEF